MYPAHAYGMIICLEAAQDYWEGSDKGEVVLPEHDSFQAVEKLRPNSH